MLNNVSMDLSIVKSQPLMLDGYSEASLYHQEKKFGFFSVLTPGKDGVKRQQSYTLPKLQEVIQGLPLNKDTWISQAEFTKPNRRAVNLARLSLLFVDIDCYNVNLAADQALSMALLTCEDIGLPPPSIAVNSGRGLQLKWILDKSLPRFALPRWNALQIELVESFKLIGADPKARDASRVLRLPGSINTKSGQLAYVQYVNRNRLGGVASYDFEYLAEILLPNTRHFYDKKLQNHPYTPEQKNQIATARIAREAKNQNTRAKQTCSGRGLRGLGGKQLAWDRLEDLRTLNQIRNGVKQGQGMNTLFMMMNFLTLSGAVRVDQFYLEANELCLELGFGELRRSDELRTLYSRAKDFEAGKLVTFQGKEYPALYTPTNQSLIELFAITDDEQRQLRTIISSDLGKERDRDRKRKKRHESGENKMTREEYLAKNAEKRDQARQLKAAGMSNREIAKQLQVSKDSIRVWLSKGG